MSLHENHILLSGFCYDFFVIITALNDKSNIIAVKYSLMYVIYYYVHLLHLHCIKEIMKTWCLAWRYSSKNPFIVTCVRKKSDLKIFVNH